MSVYEVGPFHLRVERLVLVHGEKSVPLGPKVVETMLALVERAGEVLSKEVLLARVWPDGFVDESNLAQNIYVLRKTFRSYGADDPIETVPRGGYRLTAAIRRLPEPAAVEATGKQQQRAFRRSAVTIAFGAAVFVAVIAAFVAVPDFGQHSRQTVLSGEGARLYAIGRYYWNLRTADGIRKSMRYFTQAIDSDPDNALGYVGMADANEAMGDYCYGTHRPRDYFARARAYATKALVLDPQSAPAHASLGFEMLHERDYAAALPELRRAMAIDPSYAPAREWYGIALARRDRLGEAQLQLEKAASLDPISTSTTAWLSRVAYRQHRFGDALAYWRETIEMAPDLAKHPHLREHPTWASIEDTVH
jgi:DNA-binding winged helix-turn-helix (wHTH) protein